MYNMLSVLQFCFSNIFKKILEKAFPVYPFLNVDRNIEVLNVFETSYFRFLNLIWSILTVKLIVCVTPVYNCTFFLSFLL